MRLIKSRIPRTTVPVMDGAFTVNFVNYKAVVPAAVAALLLMGSDFFTDAGPVGDAVQNARVLVVRDSGLGDVLMTTPLVRKLAADAGATVDVLTEEQYRCLFENNPHVHETLALDGLSPDAEAIVFDRYDVVLDLRLVVENAEALGEHLHRADAFAAYGGFTLTEAERKPDVFLEDWERERTARYSGVFRSEASGRAGVVGYVWASTKTNRNWSDATHDAVLAAIEAAGYGILLLGDASRRMDLSLPSCAKDDGTPQSEALTGGSHIIDLMGDLTLRETIAVMSQCDAIVSPDTGLFHVAGALEKPTLTYFGAFPLAERAAHTHLSVLNDAGCCALSPCRSYRCFNRDTNGQPHCLTASPAAVAARLEELLHVEPNVGDGGDAVDGTDADGGASATDENVGSGDAQPSGRGGRGLESRGKANVPLPDPAASGASGI